MGPGDDGVEEILHLLLSVAVLVLVGSLEQSHKFIRISIAGTARCLRLVKAEALIVVSIHFPEYKLLVLKMIRHRQAYSIQR